MKKRSIIFSLFFAFVFTLSVVQMNNEVAAANSYAGYEYLGQYEVDHDDYELPVKVNVYRSYTISSYKCLSVDDVPGIPPRIDHQYGDVGDTISIIEGSSSDSGFILNTSFGVGMGVEIPFIAEASAKVTYDTSRTWTTFIQEGTSVSFEINQYAASGTYELQKCNNYRAMRYEIYYPEVVQEAYWEWKFWPFTKTYYDEVWGYTGDYDQHIYYAAQDGTFYRLVKYSDLPY